jgi:hypothetical protein
MGAGARPVSVGTIGSSWTFEKVQTFNTRQNILAVPLDRYVSEKDDETVTEGYILTPPGRLPIRFQR